MESKVDICNLALIEAKYDNTIESLDEATVAAERCKRLYDTCRRELLAKYPWSFDTKFMELPKELKGTETEENAFLYPKNAIRILRIYSSPMEYERRRFYRMPTDNVRVAFVDGRKSILSKYDRAFVQYIYDEDIEDNFSPSFTRLLYLTIALTLAKLSGASTQDLQLIMLQIQETEREAQSLSVREDDNHIYADEDLYIRVRG